MDEVSKWVKEQIDKPVDEDVNFLLSCLQIEENDDKPGKVVKVLENLVSSVDVGEVGERINRTVNTYKTLDVVQKIVTTQRTALTELLSFCESKTKGLKALKF